jgi:circadian clock protein KaiB
MNSGAEDERAKVVAQAPAAQRLVLTLFVTGSAPSSVRARRQLRSWIERCGSSEVQLEVVDVLEHPDVAETECVLATPALVRHEPGPRRKIVGDLSEWDTVVLNLDLEEAIV